VNADRDCTPEEELRREQEWLECELQKLARFRASLLAELAVCDAERDRLLRDLADLGGAP
jgi:hypothetical protein